MQTLDKHFRNLTQAAFQRYGFAYAELLSRWPAIVGDALAEVSQPERINWPRGFDGRPDRGQPGGGTLIVRAQEGRGLELHYMAPNIIDRINGFYGYGAIANVKVIQGKLRKAAASRTPQSELGGSELADLEARLETIGDENLRAALQRLGTGALASTAAARKTSQS